MLYPLNVLDLSFTSPSKQALAAAAEGRAKYLTARLRPGDPLSHPLVSSAVREGGGESKRRGLLLRVAKKEKNKRLEAAPDEEELGTSTSTTVTSVAAVVSSGVSFPGLADVQYAGWDARAPRNQAGRLLPAWAGGRGGGGSPFFSSSGSILPGEPLLAVPPVFFASDVAPAPVASAPVAAAAAVAAPAATDEAR